MVHPLGSPGIWSRFSLVKPGLQQACPESKVGGERPARWPHPMAAANPGGSHGRGGGVASVAARTSRALAAAPTSCARRGRRTSALRASWPEAQRKVQPGARHVHGAYEQRLVKLRKVTRQTDTADIAIRSIVLQAPGQPAPPLELGNHARGARWSWFGHRWPTLAPHPSLSLIPRGSNLDRLRLEPGLITTH